MREGYSFSGLVLPDDTVATESVVGIEPCNYGVVIGCQINKFTHANYQSIFVAW